jgi:hypothetical protein
LLTRRRQQRRLADPRRPLNDHHPAVTSPRRRQRREPGQLPFAREQPILHAAILPQTVGRSPSRRPPSSRRRTSRAPGTIGSAKHGGRSPMRTAPIEARVAP